MANPSPASPGPNRRLGTLAAWLSALLIVLIPPSLAAQELPLTPEFRVNTYTAGGQIHPSVAVGRSGDFVVVWMSDQDGSSYGIFGQRYDHLGQPLGAEFAVNSYTTGVQRDPSVGTDDAGGFVVVWASQRLDDTDYGILGQRFDASGSKAGAEFRVNTYTTNRQDHPKIAVNGDGSFVVIWNDSLRDFSATAVTGQRFNAAAAKVGSDFQANTYTGDFQENPAIAADAAGDFVIVWDSRHQDGSSYGIFGQRFDRAATKLGPEIAVNTYTIGAQLFPAIASDARGNFVVVWQDFPTNAAGQYGVFAQRFNSGGEKLGSEIPVTDYGTSAAVDGPTVAEDAAGGFLVAWNGLVAAGAVLPPAIYGKRFDRSGQNLDNGFAVSTSTLSPSYPIIASARNGDVVAAWSGRDDSGGAPSAGVISRRAGFSPDALVVDGYSGKLPTSDVNGVLEPDESVIVAPIWKNVTGEGPSPSGVSLTGTADVISSVGGGSPAMVLSDTTADYGVVLPDQANNCHDTSGSGCYRVALDPENHAGIHQDLYIREILSTGGYKRWLLHVGDSFDDVPRSQPFYRKIETLFHNGITTGCTASGYCPGEVVSRGQMAIFIARGIAGSGENVPAAGAVAGHAYDCASGGTSLFADVAPTDSFCKHAHYLGAHNVTLGCSGTQYCPSAIVTRDVMASFMAKAVVAPGGGAAVPSTYTDPGTGLSYSCASGSPNLHFTDVPVSNSFCKHIHYLWAKGIVAGCTATTYCPSQPVARDAMAKFIANGFHLQLYGP